MTCKPENIAEFNLLQCFDLSISRMGLNFNASAKASTIAAVSSLPGFFDIPGKA